jgi:hypothetical protein
MRLLTVVILFFLHVPYGLTQESPNPDSEESIDYNTVRLGRTARAVRIDEPIEIDGVLDESAWSAAPIARTFTQNQPNTGAPALYATEVRILFDEDNLYIGAINYDPDPDSATVNDITEDFDFQSSDVFGLILDSLDDDRSGFLFNVNPRGGWIDAQVTNDGQMNLDWDAVWEVQTTRNSEAWIAEYRIPFRTLRFSNAPVQEWGINMQRLVRRFNETSHWTPLPPRYGITRISMAGRLEGLEGLRRGQNLKIKPFVVAGFSQSRSPGDPFADWLTEHDFDGGVDAKYGLTQSLTLDATYRTDFAQVEVDEQQVNLTRFNLFFPEKREFFLENAGTFNFGGTGGGENVIPFFSRRIGLSSQGTPIPIVGGARLTGKIGRYDVGVLTMTTESTPTSASNTYTVARVKQNVLSNSWVGGIITNRDSSISGDYNRTFGADVHLRFFNKMDIDSYILSSNTPGLVGGNLARKVAVEWRDDEFTIRSGYQGVQPNFNPEVGFLRRANAIQYTGQAAWNPLIESSDLIRNLTFGAELEYYESSTNGAIESRTKSLNMGVRFQNQAAIDFSVDENFERLAEDFPIRIGLPIPMGDHRFSQYRLQASADPTERVTGGGSLQWGDFWDGTRKSFSGNVTVRPNFRSNIRLDFSRNEVALADGRFTTNLIGLRFVYALNPRAFFNAFIQYNSDRNEVISNLRFNIIHRPLSDLFVVYNDRRSTENAQTLDRALIVKFTNLFDF